MLFKYVKEVNISIGQKLWGIVSSTRYTHKGVYGVVVDSIDWNEELVVFRINQPCNYVYCTFDEMNKYVFISKSSALGAVRLLDFSNGLKPYI